MKKQALRVVAQEISQRLKLEMVAGPTVEQQLPATIVDLLLEHLTEAVAEHLSQSDVSPDLTDEDGTALLLEARLEKVEQKLQQLTLRERDDGETATTGSTLPSLKHEKPKYEGVESILKYVDAGDDNGGLRLVIMNFND